MVFDFYLIANVKAKNKIIDKIKLINCIIIPANKQLSACLQCTVPSNRRPMHLNEYMY